MRSEVGREIFNADVCEALGRWCMTAEIVLEQENVPTPLPQF